MSLTFLIDYLYIYKNLKSDRLLVRFITVDSILWTKLYPVSHLFSPVQSCRETTDWNVMLNLDNNGPCKINGTPQNIKSKAILVVGIYLLRDPNHSNEEETEIWRLGKAKTMCTFPEINLLILDRNVPHYICTVLLQFTRGNGVIMFILCSHYMEALHTCDRGIYVLLKHLYSNMLTIGK